MTMKLSERCRSMLAMSEVRVKGQIACGKAEREALLWVAHEQEESAKKMRDGWSMISTPTMTKIPLPACPKITTDGPVTFDTTPPREYIEELLTVGRILRVRAVIVVRGRDWSPEAMRKEAGMKKGTCGKVLRWLEANGEYDGFQQKRHQS